MDLFNLVAKITLDSSEYEKGLESAEQSAGSFGQKIKGGIGKAAKVGAGAVLAIGAASTAASVALVKGVGNVAAYGDNIDKMSQKMGMSSDTYQEWDAVMRHSGTSMETMQASMKTLASAVETGSDAFDKLGLSQEQLSKMSQEELFETTITALQGVEDETERTYLAGKLLGRGATELGALLNTSTEETTKMRKRVHELGGVMDKRGVKAAARYQDSLQDMNTAISSVGRNLLTSVLPSMSTVMDGITEIFAGDSDKGIGMVTSGIDSLIDTIGQKMPKMMEVAGKLMTALGTAISTNLPKIITAAVGFITSNLPGAIKGLLTIAVPAITTLITSIAQSLPGMMKGIWNAIKEVAPMLIASIQSLVSQIPSALGGIISAIGGWVASNAASFAEKGGEILGKIKDGIVNAIGTVVEGFAGLVSSIAGWVTEHGGEILAIGGNILNWIISGIASVIGTVVNGFVSFVSTITGWVGAHSGDLIAVGQNVLSWIITGIKGFISNIVNGIKDMISKFTDWVSSNSQALTDVGTSILDWIVSGIADFISKIKDGFNGMVAQISDKVTSVSASLINIGLNILLKIKNGIANNISKIKDGFNGIVSAIREKITSIAASLKNIGTFIVTKIVSGLSDLGTKIKEKVQSALTSLAEHTFIFKPKVNTDTGKITNGSYSGHNSEFAKAKNAPYLFTKGTVFGRYNGENLIAGEAGPEMLLGVNKLNAMLFQSVQGGMQSMMGQIYEMLSGMQGGGGNAALEAQILDVLNRYLPGIAEKQLVLDTGAIAGAVAPGVNSLLGSDVTNRRRYNA